MARNRSGVYSPPAGTSPLLPSTLADATKLENRLTDIGTEITGSLPRSGVAPMTGPLLALPGSAAAPGYSFSGDADTGLAVIGGRLALVKDGVVVASADGDDFLLPLNVAFSGTATFNGGIVSNTTVGAGLVPPGAMMHFGGPTAPSGWLFCRGQAVSRSTYAALFSATTAAATATTNGTTTLSSVSVDLTGLGLEGAVIEGAGITSGTTVSAITSNTITLSQAATASASGVSIRLFPHGAGDGSTTFNVPDIRGRTMAGLDNMGGTSANRLTGLSGGVDGDVLGATGGAETHTLTVAQLAAHPHSGVPTTAVVPRDGWGTTGTAPGTVTSGRMVVGSGNFEIQENLESLRAAGNDISVTLTGSTTSGSAGSDAAHNNVQPTIILPVIIKT